MSLYFIYVSGDQEQERGREKKYQFIISIEKSVVHFPCGKRTGNRLWANQTRARIYIIQLVNVETG